MSRSTRARYEQPTISDSKYTFKRGKYAGFTIEEVMDGDPGYIHFLINHTSFDLSYDLEELLEEKSRSWRP